MLKRIWKTPSRAYRHDAGSRAFAGRSRRKLLLEVLEGRQLLTASLGTLSNITVPALLGYQVALDGSGNNNPQSFSSQPPTSSNPDIKVSVAQGQFWTLLVSHTPAPGHPSDPTINNEPMTFQFFSNLTPNTVSRITNLTNGTLTGSNYYTTTGKFFPRIAPGFVAQGGSDSPTSLSSQSGIAPIGTEIVQQLAFTGSNQLAMANTGSPNSSDAQFFITNGAQSGLDYNFTIFGQLVGADSQKTLTDLSKVALTSGTNYPEPNSQPIAPVTITSATLSSTNPNGVLHIDTTSAKAGETGTITVTATDPADNTTKTQTFTVTVGAYNGPTTNPISASTLNRAPTTIQLTKSPPATISNFIFSYQLLTQPAHGTASLNASTGSLVYTPNSSYTGADTFQYQVLAQATSSSPKTAISVGTVNVTSTTGAVRVIGTTPSQVLVVDPVPRGRHFTNSIVVNQVPATGGEVIQVAVNGLLDSTQPLTTDLSQIIVFGSKTNDVITVDPSVTVPATINGGTGGGKNVLRGGGGPTLEHGWFGHNLLIGGTGTNELIGRKGRVRFQPSAASKLIYAGNANPSKSRVHPAPPGGTFYRFVNGRLVRV